MDGKDALGMTISIESAIKAISTTIDTFKADSENSRLNAILDLVRSHQLINLFKLKDMEK